MPRFVRIDGDRVVEAVVANSIVGRYHPSLVWVQSDTAQIGGRYINGIFLPPVPEPEPVPQVVTRAQGKAALIQTGKWAAVLAHVDAIADPAEQALARVALDDTLEWRRDSPFLNAAAAAIGLTGAQLDTLFRTAAGIKL